jgi:hypothetical protein
MYGGGGEREMEGGFRKRRVLGELPHIAIKVRRGLRLYNRLKIAYVYASNAVHFYASNIV